MNAKQRTILFLIADTGAGHRSAANAITNAIRIISQKEQEEWLTRTAAQQRESTVSPGNTAGTTVQEAVAPPPTYRIEIVDVFEEYSRFPLREAVKLYGPTIRYNPRLFGEVFHISNREGPVMAGQLLTTPLILNGLLRLFTTVQPDIIVSIHPLLNHVTVRALREFHLRIPFLTVVTDLVTVHYSWFAEGVDGYIIPTKQAQELYLKRGLDPQKVHLLGMPIDPKFTLPIASKEELQRKFGLRPGLPVVLLVGGGDGAGGLQAAVRAISHARLPVQLMVVTGRNKRLYAHLQRTKSHLNVPITIFGFVQNMPELMHAADVIVTKAGPGTISEALSCDLPVILSGYVPGQEEGNVTFVTENDVGVLAMDPPTLIDALRRLTKPGSPDLRRQLANAKRLSRPGASFDIAQCILSYLPTPDAQTVWQTTWGRRRQRMMSGRLRSAIRIRRLRTTLPKPLLRGPLVRRLTSSRTRDISNKSGDLTHPADRNL
ncbi:galactosyldiacylglycerol synthase [Reticulibacter mediterranei]|uniref:Galactosyldiacylglycerol synthase n=1 Tax=Reticulibacter mediterranei TaxID=2778369 RepID=A0A8J3IJ14_9CHLR|nr:glycosyltransferase [Reticulibacter mediterranei]GHO92292.1 galactosyldiacylglycerol synthase [Reticulibacter mediterranei]